MNAVVRIALGVAALLAVGGGVVLVYVLFDGAAEAARKGVIGADPLSRLQATAGNHAVFVAGAYLLLCIGYVFGVLAVIRRQARTPLKLHHLFVAAVLASATLVLVAVPFLFVS